jgi:hypothetical protein
MEYWLRNRGSTITYTNILVKEFKAVLNESELIRNNYDYAYRICNPIDLFRNEIKIPKQYLGTYGKLV